MYWNKHPEFEGKHAFLSASQYHWMAWSDEILKQRYKNSFANDVGTIIHELASKCIKRGIKLSDDDVTLIIMTLKDNYIPDNVYDINRIIGNLKNFVNDSIDNRMSSEVLLFYTENAFGTSDAISFDGKKLKIFDLKTGAIQAHFEQLLLYAAYFCLEYNQDPHNFDIDLRIYQNNEIAKFEPTGDEVQYYIDTVIEKEMKLRNFIEQGV